MTFVIPEPSDAWITDYVGRRCPQGVELYRKAARGAYEMMREGKYSAEKMQALIECVSSSESVMQSLDVYCLHLAGRFSETIHESRRLIDSPQQHLRLLAVQTVCPFHDRKVACEIIALALEDKVKAIRAMGALRGDELPGGASFLPQVEKHLAKLKEGDKFRWAFERAVGVLRDGYCVFKNYDGKRYLFTVDKAGGDVHLVIEEREYSRAELIGLKAQMLGASDDRVQCERELGVYVEPEQRAAYKLLQSMQIEPHVDNGRILMVNVQASSGEWNSDELASLAGLGSSVWKNATFAGSICTPEFLSVVGGWSGLRQLSLFACPQLTGDSFAPISQLPVLVTLTLVECPIDDAMLSLIGKIPNLCESIIERCSLAAKDFVPLEGTALTAFDVNSVPVDDRHVASLGRIPTLRQLILEHTQVTGRGIAALESLSTLSFLDLVGAPIGDDDFRLFPAFPQLETLYLSETKISDAGVPLLHRFPQLRTLSLSGCPISDDAIESLAALKVTQLRLEQCPLSDEGKKKLRELLPKTCYLYFDAQPYGLADEEEETEPWQDPEYLSKHPPRCIKRFRSKVEPARDDEPYTRTFSLACKCGHPSGKVLGFLDSRFDGASDRFISPLSFVCGSCEKKTELINVKKEGSAEAFGSYRYRTGRGKPDEFACPKCQGKEFSLAATVVWEEESFDECLDDETRKPENVFDAYCLRGICAKCQHDCEIATLREE